MTKTSIMKETKTKKTTKTKSDEGNDLTKIIIQRIPSNSNPEICDLRLDTCDTDFIYDN